MGREGFERLLGFHAAPTFAGLKPGSLLAFHKKKFKDFEGLLSSYDRCFRCKGISLFRLAEGEDFILILFYREGDLAAALEKPAAADILSKCGYPVREPLQVKLNFLRARMGGPKSFPHEVGLFLGYPPEDVAGFIEHKGKSFACCGYWKVYANEREARQRFDRYARCTREFCSRLDAGVAFSELLEAV